MPLVEYQIFKQGFNLVPLTTYKSFETNEPVIYILLQCFLVVLPGGVMHLLTYNWPRREN